MRRTAMCLLALMIGTLIVGTTACSRVGSFADTTEPSTSTAHWFTITTASATTTDAPITTPVVTDTTTTAPTVTTDAPVSTTVPATTATPIATTAKSVTATLPVTTTAKPVTTEAPITTTVKPVSETAPATVELQDVYDFVLNSKSMVFHTPDCGSGNHIKAENRAEFSGTWEELIAEGYSPCGNCDPADGFAASPTTTKEPAATAQPQTECDFVLNTKSKKFHEPDCGSAKTIKDENREAFSGTRDELIAEGYSPCGNCKP